MKIQKTISLLLLFLTLLLALAACGGTDTSSNTSSQDDNIPANVTTTPLPIPTDVIVTIKDSKIVPSQTTFSPGVPYHFVVANLGKKDHGFVIVPTTLNVAQTTKDDLHKAALVIIDDLAPLKSTAVDYTFPPSAVGGSYEMTSPMPADLQAGLKVSIIVTVQK